MLVFSHKLVFYQKRSCVTVRNYAETCKGICNYNLVYNFSMQLFQLKILVFVVHFLKAFWHGKEIFPKSSSQNEIVSLLIIFHLPYSKHKAVKICFSLLSHSCRTHVVSVALVSHLCHTLVILVSLVSLLSHSCCIRVARVALMSLVSGTRVVNQTRSVLHMQLHIYNKQP